MKYPWIAEAIMDWAIDPCKHKGDEIICNECELQGEICERLSELAAIISNEIKEGERLDDKN